MELRPPGGGSPGPSRGWSVVRKYSYAPSGAGFISPQLPTALRCGLLLLGPLRSYISPSRVPFFSSRARSCDNRPRSPLGVQRSKAQFLSNARALNKKRGRSKRRSPCSEIKLF